MRSTALTVGLLAACVTASPASAQDTPRYRPIAVLGDDWMGSPESAISPGGVVATPRRRLFAERSDIAVLRSDASTSFMPPFGAQLAGVDDRGTVVGTYVTSTTFYGREAFAWSPRSGLRALTVDGATLTFAMGVSGAGQAVGYAQVGSAIVPVAWDLASGRATELPLPAGGVFGVAHGVNAAGVIVGGVGTSDAFSGTAVVWTRGEARTLPTPTQRGWANATDVTPVGRVIGTTGRAQGPNPWSELRLVAWDPAGTPAVLPPTPAGTSLSLWTQPRGNDAGDVVATATTPGPAWAPRGVVWRDGRAYLLDDVVEPTPGFGGYFHAVGVDARRRILAWAARTEGFVGATLVLLEPVEPADR